MKLPSLKIRNIEVQYPVIQAGMGVRVANSVLAAEAINLGAMGTIASVGLGDIEKSKTNFAEESNRVLIEEIRKARALSGNKKALGINVMVALTNYEDIIRASVAEGIDFIITGAGLPLPLPEYVGDADVALIPVVSSGRALKIIIKAWRRKYNRMPDAVLVEGPTCGGHLGFSFEELEDLEGHSTKALLPSVQKVLEDNDLDIPIIAAAEIATRGDIEESLRQGYHAVQIGTRFLATHEAGIALESKKVFINAVAEDVVVIKSPVGLPVRVLKTPLVERVMAGQKEQFTCPYHCLKTCRPRYVPFCIAKALIATWSGDYENGIFMSGSNIESVTKLAPLKEFFDTLE